MVLRSLKIESKTVHNMKSHGRPAEWSDTYRCVKCGIVLTFAAEDMVDEQEAQTYNLPCSAGKYFKHDIDSIIGPAD